MTAYKLFIQYLTLITVHSTICIYTIYRFSILKFESFSRERVYRYSIHRGLSTFKLTIHVRCTKKKNVILYLAIEKNYLLFNNL